MLCMLRAGAWRPVNELATVTERLHASPHACNVFCRAGNEQCSLFGKRVSVFVECLCVCSGNSVHCQPCCFEMLSSDSFVLGGGARRPVNELATVT